MQQNLFEITFYTLRKVMEPIEFSTRRSSLKYLGLSVENFSLLIKILSVFLNKLYKSKELKVECVNR